MCNCFSELYALFREAKIYTENIELVIRRMRVMNSQQMREMVAIHHNSTRQQKKKERLLC